jgi:hypothetical protein
VFFLDTSFNLVFWLDTILKLVNSQMLLNAAVVHDRVICEPPEVNTGSGSPKFIKYDININIITGKLHLDLIIFDDQSAVCNDNLHVTY